MSISRPTKKRQPSLLERLRKARDLSRRELAALWPTGNMTFHHLTHRIALCEAGLIEPERIHGLFYMLREADADIRDEQQRWFEQQNNGGQHDDRN